MQRWEDIVFTYDLNLDTNQQCEIIMTEGFKLQAPIVVQVWSVMKEMELYVQAIMKWAM